MEFRYTIILHVIFQSKVSLHNVIYYLLLNI